MTDLFTKLARRFKKKGKAESQESGTYWNDRYVRGGNSGPGSYAHLAQFKSEVINAFISQNNISQLIDFGCGDGNQLSYLRIDQYKGFDVSREAIELCRKKYAADTSKSFILMDDYHGERAELTMSLDVIFHLIEDDTFETYMQRLFDASTRYVICYASNRDAYDEKVPHVKHRVFTDWVEAQRNDFRLVERIQNKFPYDGDYVTTSFSDFYFFEKLADRV